MIRFEYKNWEYGIGSKWGRQPMYGFSNMCYAIQNEYVRAFSWL